jgi:nucleoside-diphosphate-sugar epimerase
MRVLITGAQGFVGRYLVHEVLNRRPGARVLGLGRSPRIDGCFTHYVTVRGTAVPARLPDSFRPDSGGAYEYAQVDLGDAAALRRVANRFQPDCVVHLASGLRGDDAQSLAQTNATGTASLLTAIGESCRTRPAVVLGSTGGVYGAIAGGDLPVVETVPCRPADVYSATKLAAEQIGRVLCDAYGMRYVAARLFNVVGPGQSERHVCGRFASLIADAASSSRRALRTGCLTSTRDYVDVRDAAAALAVLAESGMGTYNVASGRETDTGTVLTLLSRHAGLEGRLHVEPTDDVLPGVSRHAGCVNRLAALGYAPAFTLQESLRDVLDYYFVLSGLRDPSRAVPAPFAHNDHGAAERAAGARRASGRSWRDRHGEDDRQTN